MQISVLVFIACSQMEKDVRMAEEVRCVPQATSHWLYLNTSGKNHFHEMNGDVGMAGWK